MALVFGTYSYPNHSGDGSAATYQARINALVDAMVATEPDWSRVYSQLYDTGYVLVIMRHTNDEEVAFVVGSSTYTSPFDTSNVMSSETVSSDRLYIAYKPDTGAYFPTGTKDPNDADFCADCDATLFAALDDGTSLRAADREFEFILDETYARVWINYEEVAGTPNGIMIMSPFGAGTLFDTGTMQAGDVYGAFFARWKNGNLGSFDPRMQVYNRLGTEIGQATQAGGQGLGRVGVNTSTYFINTEPWPAGRQSISLNVARGGGRKGVIDKAYFLWIAPTAVSNKTTLETATYKHMRDGMVWPWNPAW